MDFDARAFSTGSGILFVLVMCLLFILCCRRRNSDQGSLGSAPQQQQPRGRRQKNARRKWRRRRENHHDRAVIVEHEVPCPESAVPGQPTQPPVHNPQYIINLNPPSEMPFQTGHYPPPPFQAQQPPWQQVGHNVHFPAPPHVSGVFPQGSNPAFGVGPYVAQQQQPGGFAQLYAQAQPDMNVFPQPPPPYETEPFPHLPSNHK